MGRRRRADRRRVAAAVVDVDAARDRSIERSRASTSARSHARRGRRRRRAMTARRTVVTEQHAPSPRRRRARALARARKPRAPLPVVARSSAATRARWTREERARDEDDSGDQCGEARRQVRSGRPRRRTVESISRVQRGGERGDAVRVRDSARWSADDAEAGGADEEDGERGHVCVRADRRKRARAYGARCRRNGEWETGARWEDARVLMDPYAPLVEARRQVFGEWPKPGV